MREFFAELTRTEECVASKIENCVRENACCGSELTCESYVIET